MTSESRNANLLQLRDCQTALALHGLMKVQRYNRVKISQIAISITHPYFVHLEKNYKENIFQKGRGMWEGAEVPVARSGKIGIANSACVTALKQ